MWATVCESEMDSKENMKPLLNVNSRAYRMVQAAKKPVTFQAQQNDTVAVQNSSGQAFKSPSVNNKEPGGVSCPSCKLILSDNKELGYHLLANCNTKQIVKMGCTYCDKKFSSPKELKEKNGESICSST